MKSQLNFILCLLSLTILSVFLYKACCKSLNTKYFNNTPKQHRINCVIKKIKADNCGIQKQSEEPSSLSSTACCIIEKNSGQILYKKNSFKKLPMASINAESKTLHEVR